MDPSKQELTIHERMVGILGDLPAIGATQKNTQQGYMFRGYADVLAALNPKLAEWGVFFVPEVMECVPEERKRASGSGSMYVTRLHVRYTFYGLKGDSVTASAWGEGSDAGDKGTSKAMTGAMKYCLFQAFAIAVHEAQDGDASTPEPSTRQKSAADLMAERKAEWGDKPLPEGWGSYEEMDAALAMVTAGMKNLLPDDKTKLKAFRDAQGMEWPLSKPNYDAIIVFLEALPPLPEGAEVI